MQSVFDMDSSLKIEGEAEPLQQDGAAAVTFDHVTMSYQGGGDAALENLNFEAKPGQTIGIIGGTGSGKSTLVNLIPRFYDVSEGAVLIDGQDVRSLPLDDLRQSVGIVMQKAVLFQGTIYDNILWGNEDATEEEVIQAVKGCTGMGVCQCERAGNLYESRAGRPKSFRWSETAPQHCQSAGTQTTYFDLG